MKLIWTNKKIQEEALKYSTKNEFKNGSVGAYNAARKNDILNKVCSHMPKHVYKFGQNHPAFIWSLEELQKEALKYSNKPEFAKSNSSAYTVAYKNGLLDRICEHMLDSNVHWTDEMLRQEALKYTNRSEFKKNSRAYSTALGRGILDKICAHMKRSSGVSAAEEEVLSLIKSIYPTAKKKRDMEVSLVDKPHIRGFEIDIYIPELKLGIEFDGKYWHSYEGLKRSRPNWPDEDIRNYHELKNNYFKSKNINIFHISEKEWKENREFCLHNLFYFMENNGL